MSASEGVRYSAQRALEAAIDDAYFTFARYRVGTIAFEPHAHTRTAQLVAALAGSNRRTLDELAVATYLEGVGSSLKSDVATLKALLPRALDLATPGREEIAHFSVALLGDRLNGANWRGWPAHERTAIDAWARAWFAATLATADPHGTVLEDVLCAVGTAYDDLATFLATLQATTDPRERKQLAHLVLSIAFTLSHARAPKPPAWSLVGSHWRKGARFERQMLAWFATYATAARVIVDATTGGCDCDWVRASTVSDVDAAFASFAAELASVTLA